MIKKKIPTWPWWLLGGKKEKETEARGKGKVIKRKELELESFGSSGSESVAVASSAAAAVDEWSVGWTEPLGPGFQSDEEGDDGGFLVLVPCYRAVSEGSGNKQLLTAVKNLPSGLSPDGKNYMDQWFSSLRNL
ncbi:hypothetical protein IGI04_000096 [Brassica rapa subsp. trilocularis]|uniref:Uncharacterized protein n=2 Tax=Brassica TaxID=3705 RepID=A0ABQ8EFK0_BRANA|nr:uncharacterized protein LOC106435796 [Brassica napus]KAG5412529.1 hypothetical protein IGI04_000096 [Brassica rapa subsp. trilocularis]KAH0940474.1 hypothetical protein HID58_000111 [Brassica napus]